MNIPAYCNCTRDRAQVLPTQFSGHVHYQQAAIIISSPDVPGLLQGLVNGLQHGAISQVVTIYSESSPTVDSSSTPSRYTAALQQTIDPASEPPRNQSPPADQGSLPEGRAAWVEVFFRTSWTWWDHSTATLSMVWIRDISWGSPLW